MMNRILFVMEIVEIEISNVDFIIHELITFSINVPIFKSDTSI